MIAGSHDKYIGYPILALVPACLTAPHALP